jgi:hypothetical protein
MLRLVHTSNQLPASFICDPSAEFEPGMVAELTVIGNQVMATVSSGIAPIGIIDDIKTRAFSAVSWNEIIIVPISNPDMTPSGPVLPMDVKAELKYPNVVSNSFLSTVDVLLNATNGVITFLKGTPLNFDLTGGGVPDAIRTVVNYTYYVAGIPGDDSTLGSGRMTVWYSRGFFQVDRYESNQVYPVRANLYISENGLFTTRKPSPKHPAVAMVTAPPTALNSFLELLWY